LDRSLLHLLAAILIDLPLRLHLSLVSLSPYILCSQSTCLAQKKGSAWLVAYISKMCNGHVAGCATDYMPGH
jgi:hypothetical protein